MANYRFFVACNDTSYFPSDFQSTTLKTLTPAEIAHYGIAVAEHSVACEFKCDRGPVTQVVLHVSKLSPSPPRVRTEGMIVKAPENAKATDYRRKKWSVELNCADLIGMIFNFTKADRVDREDRSSGQIAMLKFQDTFGEVPKDSQLRVPLDCVCRFEKVQ
jgi:hypothetical protein